MEGLAFEEQHDLIFVWEGHFEDGHGEAEGKKTDSRQCDHLGMGQGGSEEVVGRSIISETDSVASVTQGKASRVKAWLLVQLPNSQELNCKEAPDRGILLVTGRPLGCVC